MSILGLHKENYFDDPAFINYLKYLLYWTKMPYSSFIQFVVVIFMFYFFRYPHSLRFLQALQDPKFRENLKDDKSIDLLWRQKNISWMIVEQTPWDPEELQKDYVKREEEMNKVVDDQIEQNKRNMERFQTFFQKNIELIQDDDDENEQEIIAGIPTGKKISDRQKGERKGWSVNDAFRKRTHVSNQQAQNAAQQKK